MYSSHFPVVFQNYFFFFFSSSSSSSSSAFLLLCAIKLGGLSLLLSILLYVNAISKTSAKSQERHKAKGTALCRKALIIHGSQEVPWELAGLARPGCCHAVGLPLGVPGEREVPRSKAQEPHGSCIAQCLIISRVGDMLSPGRDRDRDTRQDVIQCKAAPAVLLDGRRAISRTHCAPFSV